MGDRGGTSRSKPILPSSSENSSNNNRTYSGKGRTAKLIEEDEEDMIDEQEDVVTPYSI